MYEIVGLRLESIQELIQNYSLLGNSDKQLFWDTMTKRMCMDKRVLQNHYVATMKNSLNQKLG